MYLFEIAGPGSSTRFKRTAVAASRTNPILKMRCWLPGHLLQNATTGTGHVITEPGNGYDVKGKH